MLRSKKKRLARLRRVKKELNIKRNNRAIKRTEHVVSKVPAEAFHYKRRDEAKK